MAETDQLVQAPAATTVTSTGARDVPRPPVGSAVAAMLFERIVCGVDHTPASLAAVRQAARLRPPGGRLHLFAAVYLAGAVAAGWSAARIARELEREAGDALRRAEDLAGRDVTSRLVNGSAVRCLLKEIEGERATLLCIGSHRRHRFPGILFEDVGTVMLHESPSAVLVARVLPEPDAFPRAIVVGVDGSPHAAAAHAVALGLAQRFNAKLTVFAASGEGDVDTDALRRELPEVVVADAKPVDALLDAARGADLLVVGSRGLHGMRALGSVSERVAHRADCSVLVVRGPGIGEDNRAPTGGQR